MRQARENIQARNPKPEQLFVKPEARKFFPGDHSRQPGKFPWCSPKTRTSIRVIPRPPGNSSPNPNIFRCPPGTQHAKKAKPEGPTPKNPNILHKTPGTSPIPDLESPRLPPETVLYARLCFYLLSSAISTTSLKAGVMSFILR